MIPRNPTAFYELKINAFLPLISNVVNLHIKELTDTLARQWRDNKHSLSTALGGMNVYV